MAEGLESLSASEAARLIRDGAISPEELVQACLDRIGEADSRIGAWAFVDGEHALSQARAASEVRLSGGAPGPLQGVPVGVEDRIDTGDMPTENGSALHAGRMPSRDASVVAMLRGAGAIVLGKTATAELGAGAPGKTRNPHDPERTAGGSSGGSAAAVAARMVPLAIGCQTADSIAGAASFCGVYGFKPTHGLVPRPGILALSHTLDQVGLFARSIDDLALLAGELAGHDDRDPDSRPRARIPFLEIAATEPPATPMFGLVKTPDWTRAEEDLKAAFAELATHLGDRVEEVELSVSAAEAWGWHDAIADAEIAASLARKWQAGRDALSGELRRRIERGERLSAGDYLRALAGMKPLQDSLLELFEQRYDALLVPAAHGTAPRRAESGPPSAFSAPWSLCGMPALGIPLLQGTNGLPLGVQLVGPRYGDAQLLRTGRWLVASVAEE